MTAHLASAVLWLLVVVISIGAFVMLLSLTLNLMWDLRMWWWRRKWAKVRGHLRQTTRPSDENFPRAERFTVRGTTSYRADRRR